MCKCCRVKNSTQRSFRQNSQNRNPAKPLPGSCGAGRGRAEESGLAVEVEGGGLEIAAEIELQAVAHPPGARGDFGSAGAGFAFDPSELVLGVWIEALQLEEGEAAAFLRGVGEGEDDGLVLAGRDGLCGGELAGVARGEETVKIAADDGFLDGVIGGDEAFGGGEIFGGPMIEIGADA